MPADKMPEDLREPLITTSDGDKKTLRRVETFSENGGDLDVYRRSLLSELSVHLESADVSSPRPVDTFVVTSISLSKVILGSGMLVIPKAFQILGVPVGVAVLSLVGLMTWYTINGLVSASQVTQRDTYASVVRNACGKSAKWGILLAVFANCLGMCTVFLIIFSDILVGDPSEPNGLIAEMFPMLGPGSPFLNRNYVLAALLLLLLPVSLSRNLASLGFLNAVGVGSVVAFALSTSIVAGTAIYQGTAYSLPLWPDWSRLGDSPVKIGASLLAIAPVLLNADICHQSVFPLMMVLRPFTQKRFSLMTAISLITCNVLYSLIAVTSLVAFGDDLQDDALSNLSGSYLEPIIGPIGASVMGYTVRLGYFISLIGSFVLTLHPLRHCCLEVTLGSNFHTQGIKGSFRKAWLPASLSEQHLFTPVTVVLLVMCYMMAVLIPSIWIVISLVGSAASTLMGFIFPGFVILMLDTSVGWNLVVNRSTASLVVAVGAVLFINGFLSFAL